MLTIVNELHEFLGLSKNDVLFLLKHRELLIQTEAIMAEKNGDSLNEYYKNSKLYILSNAQDELERDVDVDWGIMKKQLDFPQNKKILDFGCGIGSAGLKFIDDNYVYFYDINQYSMKFLESRISYSRAGSLLRSCQDIVNQCHNLDIIIAWGVFEHLSDDEAAEIFEMFIKVLSRTGKIYLKTFYHMRDDYLMHFNKGEKMSKLYEQYKDQIIWYNQEEAR